jgi:hypothetical protein
MLGGKRRSILEFAHRFTRSARALAQLETQLETALNAELTNPAQLSPKTMLAMADRLPGPAPVDLEERLITWAHVVVRQPYTAWIERDRERGYMLKREALLSLGYDQRLNGRAFICSYRNLSNHHHAFVYSGSDMAEALRTFNALINSDRRRQKWRRRSRFLAPADFSREVAISLGLIPA